MYINKYKSILSSLIQLSDTDDVKMKKSILSRRTLGQVDIYPFLSPVTQILKLCD